MKRMLIIALFACFGLITSGCIVHGHGHGHRPRHRHHHKAKPHRNHHKHCAPSHYWDGHKCRHKGRGHGARKHDY